MLIDSSYQVNIIHVFMLFTEVTNLDFALNFFLLAVDVALPLESDLPLVEKDLELKKWSNILRFQIMPTNPIYNYFTSDLSTPGHAGG